MMANTCKSAQITVPVDTAGVAIAFCGVETSGKISKNEMLDLHLELSPIVISLRGPH